MKKINLVVLFILLSFTTLSAQNTIVFKESGEVLKGKITNVDDKKVTIIIDNKEYKFHKADLTSFDYIPQPTQDPIVNRDQLLFKKAGEEMIKGANNFYTGFLLSVVGTGAVIYSTVPVKSNDRYSSSYEQPNSMKIMIGVAGGIMTILGTILEVESFSHYKKAGLYMKDNSIGVSIKL